MECSAIIKTHLSSLKKLIMNDFFNFSIFNIKIQNEAEYNPALRWKNFLIGRRVYFL